MGDRANIVLRDKVWGSEPAEHRDVFLYTHWDGYKIEQIAADGLRAAIAAGRANDAAYGGRIVTDVFLKAHAAEPTLGAGVSAVVGDGGSHLVIIDFDAQTVTYQAVAEGDEGSREYGGGAPATVPFAEFVAQFASVSA